MRPSTGVEPSRNQLKTEQQVEQEHQYHYTSNSETFSHHLFDIWWVSFPRIIHQTLQKRFRDQPVSSMQSARVQHQSISRRPNLGEWLENGGSLSEIHWFIPHIIYSTR